MANLSNINNKLLVGTNGEVRIGDTATVANVKLRVKQTAQQWTAQFVNTDSSVAYGISIDTSASSYGVAGTLQCYTNSGGGFIVRNDSRVGIGTTSPQRLLQLRSTNEATGIFLERTSNYGFVQYNQIVGSVETYHLGFVNNNTFSSDILVANESGKVGIGTDNPSRDLTIGDGSGNEVLAIVASPTALSQIALGDSDDDNYAQIILDNNLEKLQIQNGGGGVVANRGITLDSSENVGIGTSSPDSKLDVESNHSQLRLTDSDDSKFVLYSYSGGKLVVRNNSVNTTVNQYTLTEDGKFGIGTISPGSYYANANNLVVGSHTGSNGISILSATNQTGWLVFADSTAGGDNTRGAIAYNHDDNGMTLRVNNNPAIKIDSDRNVGIGTTSPSGYNSYADNLVVADSAHSGISIVSGTTSLGTLMFADGTGGTAGYRGRVQYDHNTDSMNFHTAAAERMRIDSSGNVQLQTVGAQLRFQNSAGAAPYIKNSGEDASTAPYGQNLEFYTGGSKRLTIDSSGNSTFAGDVTIGGKTYPKISLTDNQGVARTFSVGTSNETFTVRNETASSDAFTISNANNATFAGDVKTTGSAIGTTQADGDYLAKLYTLNADGFMSLYTGQATPLEKVRITSYGNNWINPANNGNFGIGIPSPSQKLDVNGQMTHGGLVLKTGTSVYIDTIQTINKTLSITAATWTNTGIEGTDIGANGSYMIQVYSNAHGSTGGAWYNMYWTGVMSWYKDSANGINASEIYLNFSGHALNSNVLQLRTVQHTVSGSPANLMSLEIKTSNTLTNAPISFRFRRLM